MSDGLPSKQTVNAVGGRLRARDIPGFRVRVVSSCLADALRQYAGGDGTGRPPYAAAAPVPSWSLPSSGRRQTRSRKRAAAMTAMPATTAAPA